MKNRVLFILIMIAVFSSCKKKEVPASTPIHSGEYNNSWLYTDNGPGIGLNMVWDANVLYGTAIDSFDLNNDGQMDIEFELHVINPDSAHLLVGPPNPFPNFRAKEKNGLMIARISHTEYLGLGQTVTNCFVNKFVAGQDITKETSWGNNLALWQENPVGWYNGPWSGVTQNYFLVFKRIIQIGNASIPKYGWIELDCTNKANPKLIRWAMQ
jgi:hypothetical protein